MCRLGQQPNIFCIKEGSNNTGNVKSCIIQQKCSVLQGSEKESQSLTQQKCNGHCLKYLQCKQEVTKTCVQWLFIASYHIPCDGLIWRCWMHSGNIRSPRCHHTWIRSSWGCKQNRDSSETRRHTCCVQVHRWRHYYMWCSIKGSQSHGGRTGSPCCCRRQTAREDIFVLQTTPFRDSGLLSYCTIH